MALIGCPAPQRTLLLNRSNKTVSVKQGDSIINLDPGDRCIIAKQINTILITSVRLQLKQIQLVTVLIAASSVV